MFRLFNRAPIDEPEAPTEQVYVPNAFADAQDMFPVIVINVPNDGQEEQQAENRFCNVM